MNSITAFRTAVENARVLDKKASHDGCLDAFRMNIATDLPG